MQLTKWTEQWKEKKRQQKRKKEQAAWDKVQEQYAERQLGLEGKDPKSTAKKPGGLGGFTVSFTRREFKFRRSKHGSTRRGSASVKKRVKGECTMWMGMLGLRRKYMVVVDRGVLHCTRISSSADATADPGDLHPEEGAEGKVVLVTLCCADLTTFGRRGFSLSLDGEKWNFKAKDNEQRDEWLYCLSKQPGLYRRVEDFYDVGIEVGRGATGRCRECISKFTGKLLALKEPIEHDADSRGSMHDELRILQSLAEHGPHKAIPHLEDYLFDEDGNLFLIVELLRGGNLFSRIAKQEGNFSEQKAAVVVRAVAAGVHHLHSHGIVHRDLKPENLVYASNAADAHIKIIDYDLATILLSGEASTPCGTTHYMAPEIVSEQQHNRGVDIWALGCIVWILLTGTLPFYNEDSAVEKQRILDGDYSFDPAHWGGISQPAQDLVRSMLEPDPSKRPSAEEILAHPWLSNPGSLPTTPLSTPKAIQTKYFYLCDRGFAPSFSPPESFRGRAPALRRSPAPSPPGGPVPHASSCPKELAMLAVRAGGEGRQSVGEPEGPTTPVLPAQAPAPDGTAGTLRTSSAGSLSATDLPRLAAAAAALGTQDQTDGRTGAPPRGAEGGRAVDGSGTPGQLQSHHIPPSPGPEDALPAAEAWGERRERVSSVEGAAAGGLQGSAGRGVGEGAGAGMKPSRSDTSLVKLACDKENRLNAHRDPREPLDVCTTLATLSAAANRARAYSDMLSSGEEVLPDDHDFAKSMYSSSYVATHDMPSPVRPSLRVNVP